MSQWWYLEGDSKKGPIGAEELKRLLQANAIGLRDLVWREGMPEWQPLVDVEELAELRGSIPPPVPNTEGDRLQYPLATRWPRFFARVFDLWWESVLVGFTASYILGRYFAAFVEWVSTPGSGQLYGILCIPVALLLDAAIYAMFGNSPGKAMMGLRVTDIRGAKLAFGTYLTRNFSLWMRGIAFGLPLFNLFALYVQSRRLGKGQQATYDESLGSRVHAKPINVLRKTLFALAFLTAFVGLLALNVWDKQMEARDRARKDYVWNNPETGRAASIAGRWTYKPHTNADGQLVHMFTEQTDKALIVLGVEHAPRLGLGDYVRAVQTNSASDMQHADPGRFTDSETWTSTGTMVASSSNRFSIEVRRLGPRFWRVVAIQAPPYDYSDGHVNLISKELWKTVVP